MDPEVRGISPTQKKCQKKSRQPFLNSQDTLIYKRPFSVIPNLLIVYLKPVCSTVDMLLKSSTLAGLAHGVCVFAAVYKWDVTWVNRNPDGLHERPVIGINYQWPVPTISANVGEQITIHLTNKLGNETTSVHFHGLFQHGTNSMDGPTGVTQCPVGPGETFTQVFTVKVSPDKSILEG